MSIQNFFKSLTSASAGRRPIRRRPLASRLCLEPLEDRRLLSFSPAVDYPVGPNPLAIVAADFNADGRLDLATANSSLSVMLGNADGTFQAAQTTDPGGGSLAVGDFNDDGKLDLATADSVRLGNGNGTFQAPTSIGIDIGSLPHSVAVGDFNADGKLDLGVTSNVYYPGYQGYYGWYPGYYVGRANVLLGTGGGSFSAPNTTSLGYMSQASTVVADFNGDGNLDFATTSYEYGSVIVLLGNGNGTLGAPNYFNAADTSRSVAAGDVNGDGKLDLVAASQFNNNNVGVLLGNGAGSFGATKFYTAAGYPFSVALGELNGDGKADLVTANSGDSTVSVLLGTGIGTFGPPVSSATGVWPVGVAVGDFNGDGRMDAATANHLSSNVSVLLGDGIWPAVDPSIHINDVTVTEGNSGAVSANFTVSLSAAYSQTVSVHYATADGSATAGSDYQAASGTLTFGIGETSKTITVVVNGDRLAESGESCFVNLTDPTNAFVADAKGVGNILDDEPYVSIGGYVSGPEGNTGTTAFTFTVTLSAVYDAPVTVDYATADLTLDEQYWYGPGATAGVDYTAKSGTLTIPAGQTSGMITVLVTGDRLVESDELFFVNLSNPTSAHLNGSQALGTIVDDEPRVSIGGATAVVEGNTGTKVSTFTVTLSAAYDAPVTVTYSTADGSATAGSDYQAASATLTIPGGQTTGTITVLVSGDRLGEPNETFVVNLSSPTNATIADGQGVGTIVDDEPRISISDVTKAEGKKGQTTLFTFTVTLSAAYDQPVTMSYRTVNGTATTSDGDYIAKTGTLTFAPGETTKTITIEVKGDSKKEANETFYLDLFGNSSNSLFTKNCGLGTIANDD